ncbi:MAG: hypothetical protein ABSH28_09125 [Acidobacteriota bacterium]|jgi:hypothetical protein
MKHRVIWIIIAVLLAQYLLFRSFVNRELAWTYPLHDDQVGYLTQTYGLFEALRSSHNGSALLSMLAGKWAERSATGVMLPVQACILFLFLGVSRLTALTVNLIYYFLWQIATFLCVRFLTRSLYFATLSWGLVLAIGSPLILPGGLVDFRYDSIALSLFGIFVAVTLASDIFLDRKLSILSGLVVALLILFRYLSAVYLLGIEAVTFLVCCFLYLKRRDRASLHRVVNILLSGTLVILLAGPSLWASRKVISLYYVSPTYDHSMWNSVNPTTGRIALYLQTVAYAHLGKGFLLVAIGVVIIAGLLRLYNRGTSSTPLRLSPGLGWFFVIACLCVPFLSIYLAIAENPVAPGVMVVSTLWLLVFAVTYLMFPSVDKRDPLFYRLSRCLILVMIFGYAASNQLKAYTQRIFRAEDYPSLHEITRMYDEIAKYCEQAGWDSPRISADSVQGYFSLTDGGLLTILYYERSGRFLNASGMIGGSGFQIDRKTLPWMLESTDILILTDPGQGDLQSNLPVVADLKEMRPMLRQLAKKEFTKLGDYSIYGGRVTVHVRPSVEIDGISGDWITYDGLTLRIPANCARPSARIVLRGPSTLPDLKVSASLSDGNKTNLDTDLKMDTAGYTIEISLPNDIPTPISSDLFVKVAFSSYFLPSKLYPGSPDQRKLVLWKPSLCRIIFE